VSWYPKNGSSIKQTPFFNCWYRCVFGKTFWTKCHNFWLGLRCPFIVVNSNNLYILLKLSYSFFITSSCHIWVTFFFVSSFFFVRPGQCWVFWVVCCFDFQLVIYKCHFCFVVRTVVGRDFSCCRRLARHLFDDFYTKKHKCWCFI
jgi:hypothetical protein